MICGNTGRAVPLPVRSTSNMMENPYNKGKAKDKIFNLSLTDIPSSLKLASTYKRIVEDATSN